MPLKTLKTPVAKAKSTKKEMPSVVVDATTNVVNDKGEVQVRQLLTEFNKARVALKAAEAAMKELEPAVKKAGLAEWIKANVDNVPAETISSIKLVDENGSETRFTGMDKYPMCDSEPVVQLFDETFKDVRVDGEELDVNDYVQFTLKASFDSKVFIKADGNFDEKIYEAFKKAIDDTAKKLNVTSPLTANQVLSPKPNFHTTRWAKFTAVQQRQIHDVLPCQITLTPLVTKEPEVNAAPAPTTEPPTAA